MVLPALEDINDIFARNSWPEIPKLVRGWCLICLHIDVVHGERMQCKILVRAQSVEVSGVQETCLVDWTMADSLEQAILFLLNLGVEDADHTIVAPA
jgi:hypothetical protein